MSDSTSTSADGSGPPTRRESVHAPHSPPGYEVLEEVGRGGMGVVYKARQRGLDRIVALKMVLAAEHAGPSERERFRREAQAVARLEHPHVVGVIEVGEHEGHLFLVMEYVSGGTLERRLAGTPLPAREAATLTRALADAIQHAHERGIVHRDLKPSNILLAPQPRVADFGLARVAGQASHTLSGAVVGTPSYMAPEQAEAARTVGPLADVYSLGAILYECLTGRPPFKAESPMETLVQVLTEDPARPSRLNAQVPRDLETICLKCLQKEPGRRYPSAADLAADLGRWLDHRPIVARPAGRLERGIKWARRRPAVAALSAAVVLVAVAAFAAVTAALMDSQSQRRLLEKANDDLRLARDQEREQAGRLQSEGYYSNVALAQQLWRANDLAGARRALDACPAHLRGWEWNYLDRLCRTARSDPVGELVTSLAVSPDGRHYLLGTAGGHVSLRELATGRQVRDLSSPTQRLWQIAAAFSPQGTGGAWVAQGQGVVEFAGTDRRERMPFVRGAGTPCGLTYARDGGLLVVSLSGAPGHRSHTAHVWDGEARTVARFPALADERERNLAVACAVFSPDGKHLALLSGDSNVRVNPAPEAGPALEGQMKVFEIPSGRVVGSFAATAGQLSCAAFSPDGKLLAWADGTAVTIWTVDPVQGLRRLGQHARDVHGVAFNADGTRLASGAADGSVKIWDVAAGEELMALRGHDGPVTQLAFSPDGATLLTGGGAHGNVLSWDIRHAPEGQTYLASGRQNSFVVGLAADGSRHVLMSLRSEGDDWVRGFSIRETITGRQVAVPLGDADDFQAGARFGPDGRLLAIACLDSVRLFSTETGKVTMTLPTGTQTQTALGRALAFSSDGHRLAAAWTPDVGKGLLADHAHIQVWDRHGSPVRRVTVSPRTSHPGPETIQHVEVAALALSPDGTRLGAVLVHLQLDAGTRKPVCEVGLWDVGTGERLFSWPSDQPLHALTFDGRGERLAAGGGSAAEGRVVVWEAAGGRELLTIRGHGRPVLDLAFSPDGRRLATAGGDRAVKLWDAEVGREVLTLVGHRRPVTLVRFSPDGRRLYSAVGVNPADLASLSLPAEARIPAEIKVWDAGP